jgi:hypothetical protein
MLRRYATMDVRAIREERQCSVQEAHHLLFVSAMLDQIEDARSVTQLKSILLTYVQWKEGVD